MTENQARTPLERRRDQIKFYADIMLKLSPVIATLVLGFVTYQFQSKNAAANLLSQREQAETRLRTALFENLIGPLSGSNGKKFDAEHQRLFVELLMLNFHEHIEFKPLLIHTDNRLANAEMSDEERDLARESLRSVARRVRDRQISVLAKECLKALHEQGVRIEENENPCEPQEEDFKKSDIVLDDGKAWDVWSPKKEYKLEIRLMRMNLDNMTFKLDTRIFKKEKKHLKEVLSGSNENEHLKEVGDGTFSITPFDLPFTDNREISGKQRFALGVSRIRFEEEGDDIDDPFVRIKVIWFPEGYILPHERPVNYTEIRKMLNLDD